MKPEFNFSQVGDQVSITLTEQKGPEPIQYFDEETFEGLIGAPADFYEKNLVSLEPVSEARKPILPLDPEYKGIGEVYQVHVGSGFVSGMIADPSKSLVRIYIDNCSITLTVGYDQYPRIHVTGQATVNPIFKELGINGRTGYSAKELANLLQANMSIFETKTAFMEARSRFANFQAKVTKSFNEANDQKGNKSQSSSTSVEGFGMESITIYVPIFKGQDPVHFDIDLECEEVNGTLKFFLTSFELEKTIMETKKAMLQAEAQKFGKLPIIWS